MRVGLIVVGAGASSSTLIGLVKVDRVNLVIGVELGLVAYRALLL